MKPFLQPLTREEEAYFLSLLSKGSGEEKTYAKERLVEHNMRLVAHIAKKYQSIGLEQEELISVGCVGLMKGILSYDQTKGSKLGTYAARCIENELLMMIRSLKKVQREVSLQEPVGCDQDGNELHLLDILESEPLDIIEQMEKCGQIEKAICLMRTLLTDREQKVLSMRFGLENEKELSQKEVGEVLGISRSYVSRIEKKALNKLRLQMQ